MRFTLTLVRHGESQANVDHMLSGWMDVPLTDHGRMELSRLRMSVRYPDSEAWFSSPLSRCRETFRILFPGKEAVVRDEYKEINFRSLEGTVLATPEEARSFFAGWVEDRHVADEETFSDIQRRAVPALLAHLREMTGEGTTSATIVMHSGIMRTLIVSLFMMDRHEFNRMVVGNGLGAVIHFEVTAGAVLPLDWHWLEEEE